MRLSSFSIFLSLFATSAYTGERYEFYNGVRQMGMGGVGIATVNDETSLLLNPNGLGRLRGPILTMIDPEVHVSAGAAERVYQNTGGITDVQGLLNTLRENQGYPYHAKFQLFPSYVNTNFGMGFLVKQSYDAEVDETGQTYTLNYFNDYALVAGFNFRFWDGRVKLGFNGRVINRSEIREVLPADSTNLQISDLVHEGGGIAGDAALTLTGPWEYLPSVAGVLRDAGDTALDAGSGFLHNTTRRPQNIKQTLDLGISINPILSPLVRMQIGAEYRDAMGAYEETDSMKKVHAGMELNIGDFVFLRAGMNQRYWTLGAEMAVKFMQFQVATYGEEIGTAAQARESRRLIGKFSFRF
ncbi:MAG: hypothetical protein COT74_06970 [Bdellovibrionales bacterium CG10_big_fil_rev_8_21_14_0_10_45_34]|nr:MAG: hypothetical protein COT74_06970 [Bdellovibrionales bacterium CG10_big_fil_rev_8_21_14_0_10_45_34]